mmetsp:Transcript_36424/g.91508  ORF Transcript_36424/g.91508 Transcript_36424/m.91508 type:complete len:287 (-) Transcript_36424:28-888(-)
MQQHASVDVAAARGHDQAFQRRHAHGGVDAGAGLDAGHAAARAQVARDDVELPERAAYHVRDLLARIGVAGAVEAVPPDAVLACELLGHRVRVGLGGHGHVEGGVEHSHLRHGEHRLGGLNALQVGRVVQWRQRAGLLDGGKHVVVDDDRGVEAAAAVHHAVADALDVGGVGDDGGAAVSEHLDHALQRVRVRLELRLHHGVHEVGLVLGGPQVLADALNDATGDQPVGGARQHAEEAVLEAAAAGVEHQHVHGGGAAFGRLRRAAAPRAQDVIHRGGRWGAGGRG